MELTKGEMILDQKHQTDTDKGFLVQLVVFFLFWYDSPTYKILLWTEGRQ